MSTLTKVLIVLLSVFSLFLCGVVVTYVANADNYKEKYTAQLTSMQSARSRQQAAEDDLAAAQANMAKMKEDLEQQLSAMKISRDELENALTEANRKNDRLGEQMNNSQALVSTTSTTQQKTLDQLQATQATNKQLESQVTRLETELAQTNQTLLEKLGIIETLQAEKKQLAQANHDLETRANRYLQPSGRVATAPVPVTPVPGVAQPAMPTRQIDLDGRIVAVDAATSLASISIGEAAGVRENMRFYVTRGDQYIASLTIQYVDTDKAVGTLTQVQSQPQPGDMITTNL